MPLTAPDFIAPLLAKPVAIFGGGVSGQGVRALLGALGVEGRIYDERGAEFTAAAARQHALAVFSPGFVSDHAWLGRAQTAGIESLGELDFASLFWRGQIVAVTGTNGKTTLTEFLTHALRSVGHEAHATGNIGRPFSALVAEQGGGRADVLAVCEVSSFQAETLRYFQADATLWTNFAEDHLERHPGLENYFGAKWNLVAHTRAEPEQGAGSKEQERTRRASRGSGPAPCSLLPAPATSSVFLGSSVQRHAQKFGRPFAAAHCVATEGQPADPHLADTVFAEYPQRENFILAMAWWRAAALAEVALYDAAASFRLGRHRLARVGEQAGVTFWNDSKATNFHAVEAALAGFAAPVVLIAGGKPKGGDLAGFVHRIAPRVKHAVLIGEASAELAFHCAAFRVAHSVHASLAEAVRRAAEIAQPGEHVLLSPGFASFDMFRNYEDRGDQFERLVHDLACGEPGRTGAATANLR